MNDPISATNEFGPPWRMARAVATKCCQIPTIVQTYGVSGDATPNPRVRTRTVRAAMGAFAAQHPDQMGAIMDRIPPGTMLDIQSGKDWLEVDDDRHFPEGVLELLGREEALAFFSALAESQLKTALFRAYVELVHVRFGRSPYGLLRMVPVAWKLVYRDVCLIFVTRTSESEVTVSYQNLAATVLGSEGYRVSFIGFLLGLVRSAGSEPTYEAELNLDEARFDVHLRWS